MLESEAGGWGLKDTTAQQAARFFGDSQKQLGEINA
jgi:hypothetical protein